MNMAGKKTSPAPRRATDTEARNVHRLLRLFWQLAYLNSGPDTRQVDNAWQCLAANLRVAELRLTPALGTVLGSKDLTKKLETWDKQQAWAAAVAVAEDLLAGKDDAEDDNTAEFALLAGKDDDADAIAQLAALCGRTESIVRKAAKRRELAPGQRYADGPRDQAQALVAELMGSAADPSNAGRTTRGRMAKLTDDERDLALLSKSDEVYASNPPKLRAREPRNRS
jgi:hypothetical protein